MKTLLTVITITLLFSGCAATTVGMNTDAGRSIDSIEVALFLPKDGIHVFANPNDTDSNELQTVLLNAVINKVRSSNAKKNAQPIYDTLEKYSFGKEFFPELDSHFVEVKYDVSYTHEKSKEDDEEKGKTRSVIFEQTNSSAILFISVWYSLDNHGDLTMVAESKLYPKAQRLLRFRPSPNDKKPLSDGNLLYKNDYHYYRHSIFEDNIIEALNEGASVLAKKITNDMNTW